MKTIAFFPAHPSQVWIMDELYKVLKDKYHIIWFCRDKDILLQLAEIKGIKPIVLSTAKTKILGNSIEFFFNIFKCFYYTYIYKIDLWVSKYGAAHIAAYFMRRKSIAFTDDDVDIIPLTAWTSYPFTQTILAPQFIRQGRFKQKFKTVNSFFELCYLHPNRFISSDKIYKQLNITQEQQFAIIRLSSLMAHHDIGIGGISEQVLEQIINLLQQYQFKIFISSEKKLPKRFEPFLVTIPVDQIHQALYFSRLLIGDSQTMTTEGAVLGTQVFRFSDFSEQLSNINELEKYGLVCSYKTIQYNQFFQDLNSFLEKNYQQSNHDVLTIKQEKVNQLVKDKSDPLDFFSNVIEQCIEN